MTPIKGVDIKVGDTIEIHCVVFVVTEHTERADLKILHTLRGFTAEGNCVEVKFDTRENILFTKH